MKTKIKILDIGCGNKKVKGAIGIDNKKTNDTDLVLDIEKTKLPFKKNTVDVVYFNNVLEHLEDPFSVLIKVRKILKKNGIVKIKVPFFSSCAAHDTDHKRFFNYSSFEYFEDKENYQEYKNLFKTKRRRIVFYNGKIKPLDILINIFPKFFQNSFLAYLITPCYLEFELEVIK